MKVSEQEVIDALDRADRVFLLEPAYRRKYPPLGLAKIARYVTDRGGSVEFGRSYSGQPCDLICVASLFTYDVAAVDTALSECRMWAPETPVILGGVAASLMPKRFEDIQVFRGYSKILDSCPPVLDLDWGCEDPWNDFSYVFTSRGCPNRCAYCAVWRIENKPWINPGWRDHINGDHRDVMISDNNISNTGQDHLAAVCEHCTKHRKRVVFDNGLDVKLIDKPMAEVLARLTFTRAGMRMAFDRIEEDQEFRRAVGLLRSAGVPKSHMFAYVLFNFKDTPEEANYRARTCVELGVRPYPQQFTPLDCTSRKATYIGEHWTPELVKSFRYFWLMAGIYAKHEDFFSWVVSDAAPENMRLSRGDLPGTSKKLS